MITVRIASFKGGGGFGVGFALLLPPPLTRQIIQISALSAFDCSVVDYNGDNE